MGNRKYNLIKVAEQDSAAKKCFQRVTEALAGIKVGVLARKYEVTPKTIRNWVKKYQATFDEDAVPTIDERIDDAKRLA